jgi:hypothetical protein
VPLTPPHITASQMKAYASALWHGDKQATRIVMASIKETWASLFPPK